MEVNDVNNSTLHMNFIFLT